MNFRNFAAAAALVALSSLAQAALIDRGNGTVYDSTQNITWLQDWNVTGVQNWATQKAWAENLGFAGSSDWALPSISQYGGLFSQTGDLRNPSLPFNNVQGLFVRPNRSRRRSIANYRSWPHAGAQPVDFIATLPTAGLYPQRPLWSRQIEKS